MDWRVTAVTCGIGVDTVKDLGVTPEMSMQLAAACESVHSIVSAASVRFFEELRRHCYSTPATYLDLINLCIRELQVRSLISATRPFCTD